MSNSADGWPDPGDSWVGSSLKLRRPEEALVPAAGADTAVFGPEVGFLSGWWEPDCAGSGCWR
jgi:hypothetical protein